MAQSIVIAPKIAEIAPEQATQLIIGDCSLVNNYDWPTKTAWAICMAESHGDPKSFGDGGTAYPSIGLMQIRTLPGRPSKEQLEDPVFNMDYAYNMWKSQGFNPWTCFTSGAYLQYL